MISAQTFHAGSLLQACFGRFNPKQFHDFREQVSEMEKPLLCPYLKNSLKSLGTPRFWSSSMKSVRIWVLCQNCAFCQVISFWETKICKHWAKQGRQTVTWAGLERKTWTTWSWGARNKMENGSRGVLLLVGQARQDKGASVRRQETQGQVGGKRTREVKLRWASFCHVSVQFLPPEPEPWLAGSHLSLPSSKTALMHLHFWSALKMAIETTVP